MKKKFGFSLAEALITLLIVCLITLATVPVLTKKKRQGLTTPRGLWMCTLDENGKHVVYSNTSGEWTNTGSECIFTPPQNARNFEITAVGGGGGGASGFSESRVMRIYGVVNENQKDFAAPADGEYEAIVIGGGGQGANRQNDAPRCQENIGGAGGSGGFDRKTIRMYHNQTYKIEAGLPGTGGDFNGGSGGASFIKDSQGNDLISATGGHGGYGRWGLACAQHSKKDPQDSNWGKRGDAGSPNGVQSIMVKDKEDNDRAYANYAILCRTLNVSVTNNLSGYKIGDMDCQELIGSKYLASNMMKFPYSLASNGYAGANYYVYGLSYGYGGKGRDSMNMTPSSEENDELYETDKDGNIVYDENGKPVPYDESKHMDDPVVEATPPTGGNGRKDGGMGVVLLRYNLIYSGNGGKAGETDRPAVVPSLKKVTVTIGKQGKGAQTANTAGGDGGITSYLIEYKENRSDSRTASGGKGGTTQYRTKSSITAGGQLSGGTGDFSPVQLYNSHATGGLGGYNAAFNNIFGQSLGFLNRNYFGAGGGGGGANGSETDNWGNGGDGAPGAVIIQW